MMNLVFIFVAFGWFCLADQFKTRKYLPFFILKLFEIFSKKKKEKKNSPPANFNNKTEEIEELCKKVEVEILDFNSSLDKLNLIAFIFMLLLISISYAYILVFTT